MSYTAKKLDIPATPPPTTPAITHVVDKQNIQVETRPLKITEYHPNLAFDIVEYFQKRPLYKEVVEETFWRDGEVKTTKKQVPNTPPSLEAFGREVGISVRTLKKWAAMHEEFAEAVEQCEDIIKSFFIEHGLSGHYNSSNMIFIAKNTTNMKDKHTNENLNINVSSVLDDIERSEKPLFST